MCCDKLSTAQYFFEKNNVLWQKKIRWQIHTAATSEFTSVWDRSRKSLGNIGYVLGTIF